MASRTPRGARLGVSAVQTLRRVIEQHQSLESAFDSAKSAIPRYEHGTLRELCSGSIRHWHSSCAIIDAVAPAVVRDDLVARVLMATTIYEAEHMRRASRRQLLARLVGSAEVLALPDPSAVVDACTRALALKPHDLKSLHTEASALSLPEWLHARLSAETPLGSYAELVLRRPDVLTLCVEPSVWSRDAYAALLRSQGLEASLSSLAPLAVLLHSRPRDVRAVPGLPQQHVHVQDAAQQYGVTALLRQLAADERVLDACAAPGGKTRALLRAQPHVRVVALEKSGAKVAAMKAALADGGLTQVSVRCADATQPERWWDGRRFGAVLLDAPCTGTGILRARPEVKLRHDEPSLASLQQTQLRLLRATWPLLREGGELLYTTCSMLAAENQDVVAQFLAAEPTAAATALPPPRHEDVSCVASAHGVTFFPSAAHQGGFVALLRKAGDGGSGPERGGRRRRRTKNSV